MRFFDTAARVSLILGVLCLLIAFPLFSYIAKHPEFMLWVEENQPALGIMRGRELLKQGKTNEAILAIQSAIRFFGQLVQEQNLERHRIELALAKIELANVYTRYGSPAQKEEAIPLLRQAVELEPHVSQGTPFLILGNLFREKDLAEEAIQAYTDAMSHRSAQISLTAQFERASLYLKQGNAENAARDWYNVVRYSPSVKLEQWQAIASLPDCSTPVCSLVRAAAQMQSNRPAEALPLVQAYKQIQPGDSFGNYLFALANKEPLPSDSGSLPLQDLYPPSDSLPYEIVETIIDLYVSEASTYSLRMELSGTTIGVDIPELTLRLGGWSETIRVHSNEKALYSKSIPLQPGKNILLLQTKNLPASSQRLAVYLHSLSLLPALAASPN